MSTFGRGNSDRLAEPSQIPALIDHLFRVESGKLVAVLTRIFGPHQLELAEDVVQDTLLEAMQTWHYKGIPQNPGAWLYTVAKNKSLNILRRDHYRKKFDADARHSAKTFSQELPDLDHFFSAEEIKDDLLRMMFVCCHPAISPDSQASLILKTLCGFSIPEIAHAFLSTEENIHKRLVRARKKIREANLRFEMPGGDVLQQRLDAVLQAIYLLFNEGYSASSGDQLIRFELCEEAIRLAELLAGHPGIGNRSNVFALEALMLFNTSRFHARLDSLGKI